MFHLNVVSMVDHYHTEHHHFFPRICDSLYFTGAILIFIQLRCCVLRTSGPETFSGPKNSGIMERCQNCVMRPDILEAIFCRSSRYCCDSEVGVAV